MKREDVELEAVVRAAESARTKGDTPIYRLPLPAPKRRAKPAPKPKRRVRHAFDVDKVHRHDGKGQDQ